MSAQNSSVQKIEVLESSYWLPVDVERVWDFLSVVRNFEEITPKPFALHLKKHLMIEEGAKIQAEIRWAGLKFALPVELVFQDVIDQGSQRQFVDVMSKGPLKYWKHTHRFEAGAETLDGQRTQTRAKVHQPGCWLYDRIEFTGFEKILRPQLGHLLAYRYKRLYEKLVLCG